MQLIAILSRIGVFNAVFVQIVNNKIYGVEYGLFGRYGMKEDLSLREYMDAM